MGGEEIVTRGDLELFRVRLIEDIKQLLEAKAEIQKQEEWLRSGEVKRILSVSASTLQNLRISGHLKPNKIRGTWYYSKKEIYGLFKKKIERS